MAEKLYTQEELNAAVLAERELHRIVCHPHAINAMNLPSEEKIQEQIDAGVRIPPTIHKPIPIEFWDSLSRRTECQKISTDKS